MTINVIGNHMEFSIDIVTDGNECSIVMKNSDGIYIKQGKISIKEAKSL